MKKVLITGGAQGLGESIAREFIKYFDVTITYNTNHELAINLKNELNNKYNTSFDIVKCDISDENNIRNVFKNRYDILINNASISMDNNILEKTKEEFMKILEVNLVGTFLMCKEAIKNGVKEIINISSTDSVDTYQSLNIDYSCSKAGVNILTKTIALAYSNIRVISILPNWINTESVLMMEKDYLSSELSRIGQTKLLDKNKVAKKIYEIYCDNSIKSGELIRIDEGDLNV